MPSLATSRASRKRGGTVPSHGEAGMGMGEEGAEAGTRSSPIWSWVAESHLPAVLLWCTFRKVKRIAGSVAIDSDVSDSETKKTAESFKAR